MAQKTKQTFSARTRREVTGLLEDTLRDRQAQQARVREALERNPALREQIIKTFLECLEEEFGASPPRPRRRRG